MAAISGFHTAVSAFEEGIKLGARDLDSIWALYCRTTGTLPESEICLPETVRELKKYLLDIKVYDELISTGGLLS